MSYPSSSAAAARVDREHLDRLGASIRGKLQFMDYLVRAALADLERLADEPDAGTRSFLRQVVEMHASNLAQETDNMRLVHELCGSIEVLMADQADDDDRPAFDAGSLA